MGKKKSSPPVAESVYLLPPRTSSWSARTTGPIVDTHTHLASTHSFYMHKYPNSSLSDVYAFTKHLYEEQKQNVESIVDVWCEAPVQKALIKQFADAGLAGKWGAMKYNFVVGVHPHNSKNFTDAVEADMIELLSHPLACGLGEIGLDFHYTFSPVPTQKDVFIRQLRLAIRLGKPLTIHTREAEADTEEILKKEVPKEWRIHVHCFTDSPEFALRLMDHFPNLYIGITGVVTFTSNENTRTLVRLLGERLKEGKEKTLRLLLETDAPYMIPSNIYGDLVWPEEETRAPAPAPSSAPSTGSTPSSSAPASGTSTPTGGKKGGGGKQQVAAKPKPPSRKLDLSHSAMIPWTAEFVASVLRGGHVSPLYGSSSTVPARDKEWTAERVLSLGRENARFVYGLSL